MNIKKITNGVLIALLIIAAIVIATCMILDPSQIAISDGSMQDDPHTGLLLGYIYFLVVVTVVVTIVAAIMSFITKMSQDSKKSLIMLGGVVVLLFILLITYLTGDGTPMNIVGYEGSENTSGYLKMCDMFLRTSYILCAIAIIAIIASPFAKKLK